MLDINRKGLHPYQMANRLFVLAFSNEQIPISLSSQDRRWFAVSSSEGRMNSFEAKRIWDWYQDGGFEQIGAYLYARNVSKFNPGEAPAMTEFKENLLESGMSSLEASIVEMINSKQGEFGRGFVAGPFHSVCDRIADIGGMHRSKVPQSALLHALKEAGWIDLGRVASTDLPNKKRIFASPDAIKTLSRSDMRRMVETAPEPKAVVLEIKRSA